MPKKRVKRKKPLKLKLKKKTVYTIFSLGFFLVGLLFLRLKMYLSQVNVTVGYVLIFVSLLGITRSGAIGQQIFSILQEIITTPGADLVFIGGLLVGTIVFFDTSIDEILEMLGNIRDTFDRLIPRKLFSTVKSDKSLLQKNKPLTIKGAAKVEEEEIKPLKENLPPPPSKK